ncbi:hypothetical protein CL629_02225 [bacterium]|nr:hypothetical protein [bacterium]
MTDPQLEQLHQLIRKEVAHRFRTKHCEGMFEFDGKPMTKNQAIEAFVSNKREKEKSLNKLLKKLPVETQEYLKHIGDLHQYALRNEDEAGAEKMRNMMLEKLTDYPHVKNCASSIIKRFFS